MKAVFIVQNIGFRAAAGNARENDIVIIASMRKFLLGFLAILTLSLAVSAQSPANWELVSSAKDKVLKSGESLKVELKATIETGWHLYALEQPAGGPIATTIKVTEGTPWEIDGGMSSAKPEEKTDPLFTGTDGKPLITKFFENAASFDIPLKATTDTALNAVSLDVRFQLCNATSCLTPKSIRVTFAGFEDVKKTAPPNSTAPAPAPAAPVTATSQPTDLWSFIWLAVTFGAISLLTPCVFPMIPITVSYFMKHADGDRARTIKLATVYSAGIIATFSLLGMLLAVVFGAAGINLFAANPWVNLVIAAIFLVFAFNLFGFYEIAIPSSVLTKLDSLTRAEEGRGSAYVGALLMGLTFTLTSFTCTSPFIGTILVSTANGDWKLPLLGMLVFSTVFAIPFFILATVPRLLSSLPKSGGWLNSVKVVMGFLEVAAALKFLSNVDLVWGAGLNAAGALNYGKIFTREIVLTIWVVIGLAICGYILGLFKFKHDSPIRKITPLRIVFAGVFLALSGYLTTGILGRKLGELESFLPPKNKESVFNVLGDRATELEWITNRYPDALSKAKAENKRVFIDFTGYTCTNCRWMEANMFVRPEVRAEMNRYVLASLYTDGDGDVYERQQQMEQDMFGTVALPWYAVVDADGRAVASFPGLTRNPEEFVDFLRKNAK